MNFMRFIDTPTIIQYRSPADIICLKNSNLQTVCGVFMNKQILILFGLSIIQSNLCQAETKIHITTGFTSPVSDFYNSVLTEADKRLKDISISFEVLPAERSLKLANQGLNDGECCRIPAVTAKEYKNLIPVNESFFAARFSAFAKTEKKDIKSFSELKPYAVGTVEGWKIAVIKIKEVNPAETHIVTTPQQMFNMIEQKRIDYGVVGYLSGLKVISELKLKNIKAINPPLIEKNLYLLLHEKHKDISPQFDKVFSSMKADGTIDKLYNGLIKSLKQ